MGKLLWLCSLFLALVASLTWVSLAGLSATESNIWYVTTTGNNDNDCQTPDTPCATIMGALAKPGFLEGDTILVAQGVYTSTDFEVVLLDQNATLSGGWDTIFSSQGPPTIIEGNRGVTVMPGVTANMTNFEIWGFDFGGLHNQGNLTLSQVSAGAGMASGLYNAGTLTIANSRFASSHVSGIVNVGILVMTNTLVTDNDGNGISNSGTLTMYHSTVSQHFLGRYCLGISNTGNLMMVNSAIIHNGGIYPGFGGGMCNYGGYATLINCTVSDNVAPRYSGGGIDNAGGQLALYNTTIANNGATGVGGIYNNEGGLVTLQNSILAENGKDCGGTTPIISLGYNLIGNTEGCIITGTVGDLLDVDAMVYPARGANPPYAPLSYLSPAIDAGNPTGCTDNNGLLLATDQRGVLRVGPCDIGSYEYDPLYDPLKYLWFPFIRLDQP